MLNILRMCQLILSSILIMILFKVMNLILILIITVMTRSQPEIWQRVPTITKRLKFLPGDLAVVVEVHGVEDGAPDVRPRILAERAVRLTQAVEAQDLCARPGAGGVEVVEGEEGAWVEVVDVVFLLQVLFCP